MNAARDAQEARDDLAGFDPPSDPSFASGRDLARLADLRDLAHRLLGSADGSRLNADDLRFMPLRILEGYGAVVRRRLDLLRAAWDGGRFDWNDRSLPRLEDDAPLRELEAILEASRARVAQMEDLLRQAGHGQSLLGDRLRTDPAMIRLARRGFGTSSYSASMMERVADWVDAGRTKYRWCAETFAAMGEKRAEAERSIAEARADCVESELHVARLVYDRSMEVYEGLASRIASAAEDVRAGRHDPDAARMDRFLRLKDEASAIRGVGAPASCSFGSEEGPTATSVPRF